MSKVSVIIPVFNATRTLEATLASALAQTYRNIEIIVVDDGSTDKSAQYADLVAAKDPRVRVLRSENFGVASARNIGIAAAEGKWIAPLDADDLWHPEKIERQLFAAKTSPWQPSFIYSWSRRINIEGRALRDLGRPRFRGDVLAPLIASNFMRNSSVPLISRDALEAAGGYDTGLQAAGSQGAEDLSLYLKLAEYGPVELSPAFLVGYRNFPGTMSSDPARMRRSVDLVLQELWQRRPELPGRLRSLARMNYDFYSATLVLAAGDRKNFLRFIGKALRNRPIVGSAFLGCHLSERLIAALSQTGRGAQFEDLTPEEPMSKPVADFLDKLEASAARHAIVGSAISGSRWRTS